jgi:hypothetical protein
MRHATLIGSKGGKFESIAVGNAQEIREQYKRESFPGFSQVYYLDTSGGTRRKRGAEQAPKKKAKK